jgi:hypothetical protein
VIKIVSGGQTGADRAALDFALRFEIVCGGWCPTGRIAEDGPIDAKYPLTETSTASYLQRTEKNVVDSDGTVIFSIAPEISGGTQKTADFARQHRKPLLQISVETLDPWHELVEFIRENEIRVLNVAGPRASKEPDIEGFVLSVLVEAKNIDGVRGG